VSGAKRILLLVDFKFRDLPGMAYLKVVLERQYGHRVMLAPVANDDFLDGVFQPDLVVLPYLWRPSNVARARALRDRGVAVAVILTEGHSLFEGGLAQVAGKFTDLSVTDLYFVWNEHVHERVRRYRTLPEERVVRAGVQRFDFYRSPLTRLHASRAAFCEKYGLDPARRIVTCATNFGFVRIAGSPAEIAATQTKYEEEGLAQFPMFSNIAEVVHREVESRDLIADACLRLASVFPDVTFVVKPHPSEIPTWYQNLIDAAGLKNIVVVQREMIWDVLNPTDVHLHRSCTTGVEAWLLDKPTIDMQLNPNEVLFSSEMAAGGAVARSVDEMVQAVSHYLGGGEVTPVQRQARAALVRDWYGEVDGQATARHAERLHRLVMERGGRKARLGSLRNTASVRLRWALGLEHYEPLRRAFHPAGRRVDDGGRDKFIRSADVKAWTERIEWALGPAR
jgi:surface carbohydrate biosynthesis protein